MRTCLTTMLLGAVLLAVPSVHAEDVRPFVLPMSLQPTFEEFERFTLFNANGDIMEWSFDSEENCISYSYSSVNNADDWVFIPVGLSDADTYLKVSVEALATGGFWYDEAFELAIGDAPEPGAMRTILSESVDSDEYTPFETTFTNDIEGTAWLGIHAVSSKNRRILRMRNIMLRSYATPIALKPEIDSSSMNGLEYTATVTVPSRTVQGNPVDGTVDIRFSVDGIQREVYVGLAPGSSVEVNASLDKGEHQITYVALLETDGVTTESAPACETVKAIDLDTDYALPFRFGPSDEAEFDQCVPVDANGDESTWSYSNASFYYGWNSNNQANDWMILPAVDFGDSNRIELSVEARAGGSSYVESFEVWLGREASVGAMTLKVISQPEFNNTQWQTFKAEIPVATGVWRVGLHCTSAADQYGLYLRNIHIESTGSVGVGDIVPDDDVPVEYFNLQGIPVASPGKGSVVIMRRGHKTLRTIVR